MEMVLTGKFISAEEALKAGLINKIVPVELLYTETIKLAKEIAKQSPVAIKLAKESVNNAFNSTLEEGLLFERKNFYLTFASEDQKKVWPHLLKRESLILRGNSQIFFAFPFSRRSVDRGGERSKPGWADEKLATRGLPKN